MVWLMYTIDGFAFKLLQHPNHLLLATQLPPVIFLVQLPFIYSLHYTLYDTVFANITPCLHVCQHNTLCECVSHPTNYWCLIKNVYIDQLKATTMLDVSWRCWQLHGSINKLSDDFLCCQNFAVYHLCEDQAQKPWARRG